MHTHWKIVAAIASLYMVRMGGLFVMLPVLAIYGRDFSGYTPFLLGIALGIYGLTQGLFQIPFGWLSDRIGRLPMLAIGLIIFVLGSVICAFASDFFTLIIGRAIQGAGAISGVLLALLADRVEERRRGVAMAVIGATIGITFGVSIVVSPIITEAYGFSSVFLASAGLGIAGLIIVICGFTGSPQDGEFHQIVNAGDEGSRLGSAEKKAIGTINLGVFAIHFLQMFIWISIPLVLIERFAISLDDHWKIYLLVIGGGFVAMLPLLRRSSNENQFFQSLKVCALLTCCALTVIYLSHSLFLFLLALFLFFLSFCFLEASLPSNLSRYIPTDRRGAYSGLFSTFQVLGVFLGGALAGLASSRLGNHSVLLVATVGAAFWFITSYVYAPRILISKT